MKENIFEQYPNLEEYFVTSDGQKFFKETAANTHSRTLENKKVSRMTRTDFNNPKFMNDILDFVPNSKTPQNNETKD